MLNHILTILDGLQSINHFVTFHARLEASKYLNPIARMIERLAAPSIMCISAHPQLQDARFIANEIRKLRLNLPPAII
jgi:hypothetical protein